MYRSSGYWLKGYGGCPADPVDSADAGSRIALRVARENVRLHVLRGVHAHELQCPLENNLGRLNQFQAGEGDVGVRGV